MTTVIPTDLPTWLIVLEYIKVFCSASFVIAVGGFVVLMMHLWLVVVRVNGIRCDDKMSFMIDMAAGNASEIARRVEKGEFPEHLMKSCLIADAQILNSIKKSKEAGNANPISDAFNKLLGQLVEDESKLRTEAEAKKKEAKNPPPPGHSP